MSSNQEEGDVKMSSDQELSSSLESSVDDNHQITEEEMSQDKTSLDDSALLQNHVDKTASSTVTTASLTVTTANMSIVPENKAKQPELSKGIKRRFNLIIQVKNPASKTDLATPPKKVDVQNFKFVNAKLNPVLVQPSSSTSTNSTAVDSIQKKKVVKIVPANFVQVVNFQDLHKPRIVAQPNGKIAIKKVNMPNKPPYSLSTLNKYVNKEIGLVRRGLYLYCEPCKTVITQLKSQKDIHNHFISERHLRAIDSTGKVLSKVIPNRKDNGEASNQPNVVENETPAPSSEKLKADKLNKLLEKRINQYPGIFERRGDELYCITCGKSVSFIVKDRVNDHVKAKIHKQIIANKALELENVENQTEENKVNKILDLRLIQFANQGLSKRGVNLCCNVCNCLITNFQDKSRVKDHLGSRLHLTSLQSSESNNPSQHMATAEEINRATIMLFHKLNISFEKFDDPYFLEYKRKYILSGSRIVKANHARRKLKDYMREENASNREDANAVNNM